MKRPRIPFLSFDRRWKVWRWKPSPGLRPRFAAQTLGEDRAGAETAALRLNREVERWRAGQADAAPARPAAAPPAQRTVAALAAAYRASVDWRVLAPSTRVAYAAEMARIERDFGSRLVASIGTREVDEWLDDMRERAPDAARHLGARARALWAWGWRKGLAPQSNPWSKAKIGAGGRREAYVDVAGLRALVAAADAEGLSSLGTACVIGFCAIARISDVLALTEANITRAAPGAPPRLVYGQRKSERRRGGKGGAGGAPARKQIDALCPGAILRRLITHPPRPTPSGLLVARESRRPQRGGDPRRPEGRWDEKEAARAFRRVTARAAAETGNAALLAIQMRDMRRSGFVHAIRQGLAIADIAALSGHSYATCHEMAEHYAPRTTAAADATVRRMQVEI